MENSTKPVLSANLRYKIGLDQLKQDISEVAEWCFADFTQDPDIQWKVFREQMTHIKRKQMLLWLETDDSL